MTNIEIERSRKLASFIWNNLEKEKQTIPLLIHNVVDLCSKYDITLRGQNLYKKIDGYTAHLTGTNKYLIVIDNVNYPHTRQRFTLAHELGHVILGHHTTRKHLNEYLKEKTADEFASRLLMPDEPMRDLSYLSPQMASSYFWVSRTAMAIRLEHFYEESTRLDPIDFILKWNPVLI